MSARSMTVTAAGVSSTLPGRRVAIEIGGIGSKKSSSLGSSAAETVVKANGAKSAAARCLR